MTLHLSFFASSPSCSSSSLCLLLLTLLCDVMMFSRAESESFGCQEEERATSVSKICNSLNQRFFDSRFAFWLTKKHQTAKQKLKKHEERARRQKNEREEEEEENHCEDTRRRRDGGRAKKRRRSRGKREQEYFHRPRRRRRRRRSLFKNVEQTRRSGGTSFVSPRSRVSGRLRVVQLFSPFVRIETLRPEQTNLESRGTEEERNRETIRTT